MIGRLNHVGVAVPSIDAAKATYRDLYGVPESAMTPTREMPEQGVRFAFVNLSNSQIELIEPLGENSPIRKFRSEE
ncbi:MAG: VOC family protein, partial [Hyphomonadaceae bacterium]